MRWSIEPAELHSWDLTPREAIELQRRLHSRLVMRPVREPVRLVAGVDVHVPARCPAPAGAESPSPASGVRATAAVVVLSYPALEPVETAVAALPVAFPYIPGLLSFRELPAVLNAFRSLACHPDLVLCDGQGYAHPRRFGLACHLGLLIGVPTVGVAKTLLLGRHEPLGDSRGSWVPLLDGGEVVGAAVRTRTGVKPVYVSVGHLADLASAVEWTLRCAPRYRLPETTRQAHEVAGDAGRVPYGDEETAHQWRST